MPTKDKSERILLYLRASRDALSGFSPPFSQKGTIQTLTRTLTGTSNPLYKTQIMHAENATTDLDGTFDEIEWTEGATVVSHKHLSDFATNPTIFQAKAWGAILIDGDSTFPATSGTADSADADNDALVNYLKHVRQAQVGFSTPTFLGELKEAVKMIRQPAKSLSDEFYRYIRNVKKRKRNSPKTWHKAAAGMYLEGVFGWLPLVNDIQTAAKEYAKLTERKAFIPITGFGVRDYPLPLLDVNNGAISVSANGTAISRYSYNRRCMDRAFVRYKGMVKGSVDAPTYSRAMDSFGLRLDEFIPTAWELLPWSFLIDYFSNIGDVITASVATRSDVRWTNKSVVISRSYESVANFDLPATKSIYGLRFVSGRGSSVTSKRIRKIVQRRRGVLLGTPSISFNIPGRPAQWANMAALLVVCNNSVHPQRFH